MKRNVLLAIALAGLASIASASTIADINTVGGAGVNGCGAGGSAVIGCFKIGDKLFDDFSILGLPENTVTVSGQQLADTVFINFGGPFATTNFTTGTDFQLFYSVMALAGSIATIDQSFNLSGTGNGGLVSIGESVYGDAARLDLRARSSVGFSIGADDPSDPPGEVFQGDQLNVNPPLVQVWVSKDIFLRASEPSGGVTSSVAATIITQSFHQVPDGGTPVALLGFALVAIDGLRRKIKA